MSSQARTLNLEVFIYEKGKIEFLLCYFLSDCTQLTMNSVLSFLSVPNCMKINDFKNGYNAVY